MKIPTAKIILSRGNEFLREIPLTKERMTIGRRPDSDIVINDLAISAEHAVIVSMEHESYLEDLNSTNGTQVNGQPVRRHYLRDGDSIQVAWYRIRYLVDDAAPSFAAESAGLRQCRAAGQSPVALVRVLNGAKAGTEIVLDQPVTGIGKQQFHTTVILRRAEGYYLAHVEGEGQPLLNGMLVGTEPLALQNGDVIALPEVRLRFLLLM